MILSFEQRHAAGLRACPCGSDSNSSQSTTQQDNRRVIGQGGISAEGSTVNTTTYALDGEVANKAITASTADLKAALNYSDTVTGSAFTFARQAQGQALDSLNTTANLVANAYADAKGRGAMTDKILIGSVVMAGLVAMAALHAAPVH